MGQGRRTAKSPFRICLWKACRSRRPTAGRRGRAPNGRVSACYCTSGGFLSAANAPRRSSTVSGGNTRTGGGWSISPSVLRAIFCSAMRWSPTDSAHKAEYRHPASHGVGSRLLAAIRRRAAKKAVSLAKLVSSACFTPRPLCVDIVGTPREERLRSQAPPPAKIRGSPITPPP
jgi:hypothetical protein